MTKNNMPAWLDFNCIKDHSYLLNEHINNPNAPCYRMVLVHALRHLLKTNSSYRKDRELLKKDMCDLRKFIRNLEEQDEGHNFKDFIALLPFKYHAQNIKQSGVVLIDHSSAAYPLVMFNKRSDPEKGLRLAAFFYAFEDFFKNYEKIADIISQNQFISWVDLKNQTKTLFTYANDAA